MLRLPSVLSRGGRRFDDTDKPRWGGWLVFEKNYVIEFDIKA